MHVGTTVVKLKKSAQVFLYASLTMVLAFVGLRQESDEQLSRTSDGNTESGEKDAFPNVIPYAYAETVSDCGDGGCAGCADCGDCGCCFPPEAEITTPSGVTPISAVQAGDTVVAFDETAHSFTTATVETVLHHREEHDFTTAPLLKFLLADTTNDSSFLVTSNHPVYDAATNSFKPAGEFKVGDTLLTQTGTQSVAAVETVDETTYLNATKSVYNLTLTNGPHTYVANGFVVHNKNDAGTDCCLPGHAQIRTPNGAMAIAQVKVGDAVISYDHETSTWSESVVGEVFVHDGVSHQEHDFSAQPLLEINYRDEAGQGGQLVITGNHSCFVPAADDYKPAAELVPGDTLMTESGTVTVDTVTALDHTTYFSKGAPVVYNLHMKGALHNYVADGILVHNSDK